MALIQLFGDSSFHNNEAFCSMDEVEDTLCFGLNLLEINIIVLDLLQTSNVLILLYKTQI
jgi:hypothetical protein